MPAKSQQDSNPEIEQKFDRMCSPGNFLTAPWGIFRAHLPNPVTGVMGPLEYGVVVLLVVLISRHAEIKQRKSEVPNRRRKPFTGWLYCSGTFFARRLNRSVDCTDKLIKKLKDYTLIETKRVRNPGRRYVRLNQALIVEITEKYGLNT